MPGSGVPYTRWVDVWSDIQDRIAPLQQWFLLLSPFGQPGLLQFVVGVGRGRDLGAFMAEP
jgi:hypothetical protein